MVLNTGQIKLVENLVKRGTDFPGGPVVRTQAPNAGGLGSIPGQGTRSHMSQLKISHTAIKIKDLYQPNK